MESLYNPAVETLDTSLLLSPLIQLRPDVGWVPMIGLSWFRTETEFLDIRMRPVMAGVAYGIRSARLWLGPSVVGGYAFNRVRIKPDPEQRATLANSFAWRPGLAVWWDATDRLGLSGFAGYLVTRSELDFGNLRGSSPSRFKGDTVVLTVGLGIRPF